MEARIQKLLDAVANMRDAVDANATFGEPVVVKDRTVVPVTRSRLPLRGKRGTRNDT